MSQPADTAHESVLLQKACEWFTEAVANEVSRRGDARLVEATDICTSQHIVMHHLSGVIPSGTTLSEADLRSRLQRCANSVLDQLIGDRKGEVLVVSSYPARMSAIAGHIQYDWHAGAAAPDEIQHKMAHKD